MAQVTIEVEDNLADKMNGLIQFFGSKDLLFAHFITNSPTPLTMNLN